MRPSKLLLGVAVTASLACGRTADAKDEFPEMISTHLGASGRPPCGLCHQYGKTGGDTLVTPFALAMRARGMTGGSTLIAALDRVGNDRVDSDGDGETDVDELIVGSDPNSAASTPMEPGMVSDPGLGCAVGRSGGDQGRELVAPLAATMAWLLRRHRRARG